MNTKLTDAFVVDPLKEANNAEYAINKNDTIITISSDGYNSRIDGGIKLNLSSFKGIKESLLSGKGDVIDDLIVPLFITALPLAKSDTEDNITNLSKEKRICIMSDKCDLSSAKVIDITNNCQHVFVDWLSASDFLFLPSPEELGVFAITQDYAKAGAFILPEKIVRVQLN